MGRALFLTQLVLGGLVLQLDSVRAEPAPGWHVQRWTLEDGLPVNGLTDLAQTPDGFLWIGSSGGLVRFDGQRFQRAPGPLAQARITRMELGDDGRLYVATVTHELFSIGGGRIITHDHWTFGFDRRADGLWIGARGGPLRVTPERPERIADTDLPVVTAARDTRGRLWLGTQRGLYLEGPSGHRAVELPAGPDWPAAEPNTVHALLPMDDGRLWVASAKGLHAIEGEHIRRFPSGRCAEAAVTALHPDGEHLRLSTTCGPREVVGDTTRPLAPPGCSSQNRDQVVRTAGGALSVCGADGLYIDGERVFTGPVTAQLATADGLWATTNHGELLLVRRQQLTQLGGPAADCNAYGMHEATNGDIWVSCLDDPPLLIRDGRAVADRDGRVALDTNSSTIVEDADGRLVLGNGALGADHITLLFVDREGVLWIGGLDGLFRRQDGRMTPVELPDGRTIGLAAAVYEAPDGRLIFASHTLGLVVIDGDAPPRLFGVDAGLPTTRIRDIAPAADGALWLATEDKALVHARFDGERIRATLVGPEQGLFTDHVHRILDDGRGRRWMNSNYGVFWVPEQELLDVVAGRRARVGSVVYGVAEGLPHREGNGGAYPSGLRLSDGRLAFPTQAGVAVVDPGQIERDRRPPPVHIEGLVTKGATFTASATLAPDQRDFEVVYTAPVFHGADRARFRYKLEGFDERWVEAGTRRRAYYTQVPPGRYRFVVTAANPHHVWNTEGVAMPIVVRPRFYETWWFAGAGLLVGLGLLAGGVRLRFAAMRARARHLEEQVALRTAELARQAEALEALDELKTRFFAHISHELRTPLTLIAGAVDQLPGAADDPATLDALRRNTRRLRRLTDQILDLLRGDAGLRQVALEPVDLHALARATVAAFAPMAERRIFAVLGDGCALAHPELIETVLVNLVSNAVKFTGDGGRITIRLEPVEGQVRLHVEDDGRGMPAEDVPHIFDRFYRVESSRLHEGEGTGLGLALVEELVHQQGGRVTVQSTLGEGSRFTVTLAAAERAEVTHLWGRQGRLEADLLDIGPDPERSEAADDGRARPTVLVVDDNADLRRWIGDVLADDYAIRAAVDGADGLEQARETLPDLIVADLMMPRLDGFGLVRALLDDPETACIPVLLLTARVGADAELRGLREGATDFLTKPFKIEILQARVKGILDRRARLRDALRAEWSADRPPQPPPADPAQATVLDEARAVIEARIDDPDLDAESLAAALGMSRATLGRRLRAADGPSPAALIREVRLERAHALLEAGRGNVSEVAFAVGFNSLAQFSRRFKSRFGVPPSHLKSAG